MNVKFDNKYGEMPLENKIRSIFDNAIAGQVATNGKYYVIHIDHLTYKLYALTSEADAEAREMGRELEAGKEAIFNGEKVRGITYEEEMRYNMGEFEANLDLWGNVEVTEVSEYEKKLLHKYLHSATYDYSIVSIENNRYFTIAEVQEFSTDGKTIESEYALYIRGGKIENSNGDTLCIVYGTYAADTDITFVMVDIYHNNEVTITEVLGFTYGNEVKNTELLLEQIGKLRAEFEV